MNENQCCCEGKSAQNDTLRVRLGEIRGRLAEIDKLACDIGLKTIIPRPCKNGEIEVRRDSPENGQSIEDFINLIDHQTKDIARKLIDIDGLI
jgi:hypothetical protein